MPRFIVLTLMLCFSVVFWSLSSSHDQPNSISACQKQFRQQFDELLTEAGTLELLVKQEASPQEIKTQFKRARLKLKSIEFILAYLDNDLYNKYINGAPLPKIMKKVPDLTIIEPQGFQRIQEVIYLEDCDNEQLIDLTQSLSIHLKDFSNSTQQRNFTESQLFEALRLGLLRLNALGVTGFDSPGTTTYTLEEAHSYLQGMRNASRMFFPRMNSSQKSKVDSLYSIGLTALETADFEYFDRLDFLTEVINPLWNELLIVQQHLMIELPEHRNAIPVAVNYTADNIFAEDFLNDNYFEEYIDPQRRAEQIELGRTLFFDPILSESNEMSCATCHRPEQAFTDGLTTSIVDSASVQRNSPTLINGLYATEFFHDLRTDRLSLQLDHVVRNPKEFNTNYQQIVEELSQSEDYAGLFEKAFGSRAIRKNGITQALASYVASLRSFNSTFDQYVTGRTDHIDDDVRQGYNLFTGKANCATCHFAPTFSGLLPPNFDETESEVLGVPATDAELQVDEDPGRFGNRKIKEHVPFYERSFKTSTVRNAQLTAPYMHNGAYRLLDDVIDFYDVGGGAGMGFDLPYQTLPADSLHLTDTEKKQLIQFINSLTDTSGLTDKPKRLPSFNDAVLDSRPIGGKY